MKPIAASKQIFRASVASAALGVWLLSCAAADDAVHGESAQPLRHRAGLTSKASTTTERDISRLVMQLGHDRYNMREQAEAELLKIGLPASGHLAKTVGHADLELRTRARRVLDTI